MKNSDILRTHGFAPAGDSEEARTPYWVTRVSMSPVLCFSHEFDGSVISLTRTLELCFWAQPPCLHLHDGVQGALLPASVLSGHYVFSSGAWLGGPDCRQAGVCPCILMPFWGNRTLMGDGSIEWQIQE